MTAVQFMSPEHVAAMNAALVDDAEVRAACAALGGPKVLAYRLSDGPGGSTVHWTVTFDGTVSFGLEHDPRADVVLVGDWGAVVRATAAQREGRTESPVVSFEGDVALLGSLVPVLDAARQRASFDTTFPETQAHAGAGA